MDARKPIIYHCTIERCEIIVLPIYRHGIIELRIIAERLFVRRLVRSLNCKSRFLVHCVPTRLQMQAYCESERMDDETAKRMLDCWKLCASEFGRNAIAPCQEFIVMYSCSEIRSGWQKSTTSNVVLMC